MKYKNIKIKFAVLFSLVVLFGISSTAHASLNITASVDVPSSCSATDTDNVSHPYQAGNSYLAICALEAAISNGAITSAQLSNQFPSMGLFVTSFNGVAADPNSQYWAIYQNGSFANDGISSLPVIAGDTIMFQLHDFSDNDTGDHVTLTVHSLVASVVNRGGGSAPLPPSFNAPKAISYLKSVQSSDGSFGGSDMYTDWAAVAYGAGGVSDTSRDKIISYLDAHTSLSSLLTDNERRSMALLALGQNPYSFHGTDYITAIVNSFDGTQFGDASLINDDIFALIPLSASGYTAKDEIISKDIKYIISRQQSDGSWEGSVDLTAAAVQALSQFQSISGVSDTLSKAKDYIASSQGSDGGWGNVSSSGWAIQAEGSLGATFSNNGKNGRDYLLAQQATDGAAISANETLQNRIWSTSYAIPAAMGKPWNTIMIAVGKHVVSVPVAITPPSAPIVVAEQPVTHSNISASKKLLQAAKILTQEKVTSADDSKANLSVFTTAGKALITGLKLFWSNFFSVF